MDTIVENHITQGHFEEPSRWEEFVFQRRRGLMVKKDLEIPKKNLKIPMTKFCKTALGLKSHGDQDDRGASGTKNVLVPNFTSILNTSFSDHALL